MGEKRSGKCLCGAVSFSIELAEPDVDVCHCGMCQRWAGGPSMSIKAAAPPTVQGEASVVTYKSSDWGTRTFCGRCGSHLFFAAPSVGYFGVSAGALDDLSGLKMAIEIFIDRKPAFYDFANETKTFTEAQFLEMISGAPGQETGNG